MTGPTHDFWQTRFLDGNLPWDRGAPNPQLLQWLEEDWLPAGSRVLVPGCGQGWEVLALAAAGCAVTGIDFAPAALDLCRRHLDAAGKQATLLDADVLHWLPPAPADVVFEQTCLCALYPDYWTRYAQQLHAWLKPGGKLLAMFMQAPRPVSAEGVIEGPPYHCDINAMRAIFPASLWEWPKPPYPQIDNARIERSELAVVLTRR
jgi:SAM-dependent methyltransferase